MFAENQKISDRQVFRLMTFVLLGPGTLLLPAVLAKAAGRDGVFCILLGTSAGLLYLKLLAPVVRDMKVPFPEYLEEQLGRFLGKILQAGCLSYFVLLAGYTAYLLSSLVLQHLLREESFYLILAVLIFLLFFGIRKGIEGRARVYELLFWVVVLPLLVMLFAAADEVDTDYWTPVFTAGTEGILGGTYQVFICFSLVFFLLFLGGFAAKPGKLIAAGRRATLFTGTVQGGLYLILLGIFGTETLKTMAFPAVTMMSTVRISAGFLKRLDALMFGIWFFTLYAVLSSAAFYGGLLLQRLTEKQVERLGKYMAGNRAEKTGTERTGTEKAGAVEKTEQRKNRWSVVVPMVMAGAVFGTAVCFYRSAGAIKVYEWLIWYVWTPFLILVPLLLVLRSGMKGKRKRAASRQNLLCLLLCVGTLGHFTGCSSAELEDKNFPLELAIEDTDDFGAEWLGENSSGNRLKDYNHLKVIILSRDFLENTDAMNEFLGLLEEQNEVPQNTYVVAAEDAKEIVKAAEEAGESAGTYLEEYFENLSEIKKEAYPTLGMLCRERQNRQETLFLPFITEEEGKLAVDHYYVWKRGMAAGEVDTDIALLSYFTADQMEEYTLIPVRGCYVRLFAPENEISFSEENGGQIVVDIHCSGEILYQEGADTVPNEVIEEQIAAYMNGIAGPQLKMWKIDTANSYKKLGGYQRQWYFAYKELELNYENMVDIVYNVHISWMNL